MILRAKGISKSFRQGGVPIEVLKDLSLEIRRGETVAIVGRSGSGKSTLLSLISGLDAPTQGSIEIAGADLASMDEEALTAFRAAHIGVVFQQFHLMSNLTALENIGLPLEIAGDPRSRAKAQAALEQVGLSSRAAHFPHQLSGGEKQRVAIARALVVEPGLLLADEPSGSLDVRTGERVMGLLFDLVASRGTTLVLVTHNEELVQLCARSCVLEAGRLLEGTRRPV